MQPILIASVVAILLIGTYLVLQKRQQYNKGRIGFLGQQFTPADSGTWVLSKVGKNPCESVDEQFEVKIGSDGNLVGVSGSGRTIAVGQFILPTDFQGGTSTEEMVKIDYGYHQYKSIRPNVIAFMIGLNQNQKLMLFQPLDTFNKSCKAWKAGVWDYPGTPYSSAGYPLDTQGNFTKEYLECYAKSLGTDFCFLGRNAFCIKEKSGSWNDLLVCLGS